MLKYQSERSYYTVYITIQHIEERTMSQNTIRKGNREKKPSRHHYFDDIDYGTHPGQKPSDHKVTHQTTKEKSNSTLEINQMAKLFCKFLNATNTRFKELNAAQQKQLLSELPEMPKEVDSFGISDIKKNERRSNRDVVNDPKNHRSGEFGQLVNKQQKVQTKESKARVSKNGKVVTNIAPTDLNHQSINEHLKITYFNINTIPQDLLRQLAPQNFLLQKQSESKSKSKEEKKENKTKKDEEKPFKRQAYHIGIAYHLHIKQVKNKPQEYLDPTRAARKLRQQYQKPNQGG